MSNVATPEPPSPTRLRRSMLLIATYLAVMLLIAGVYR